jgi:hypothetical protein
MNLIARTGEIGYFLRRQVWGRGYATEAAQALLQFGFVQFHRITAGCLATNQASAQLMSEPAPSSGLAGSARPRWPCLYHMCPASAPRLLATRCWLFSAVR